MLGLLLLATLAAPTGDAPSGLRMEDLPRADEVKVDTRRVEVRCNAKVRHPDGEPCIDAVGQRTPAFVGCGKASGRPAEFADYFVCLAGADSGAVHKEGTGCIACPFDCPGGLITDVSNPINEPKPTVILDWLAAPSAGATVLARIRPDSPKARSSETRRPSERGRGR